MHFFPAILLIANLFSCQWVDDAKNDLAPKIPYNFSHVDQTSYLPDTLREISGITQLDASTIACVQDENGIVFIYDLAQNRIQKQFTFHLDGDYEGITKVEEDLYILRSDGLLFRISDYALPAFKIDSFATGIPVSDNEGLCHDAANNRLLIGCKSKPGKGAAFKDQRVIYGFDLQTKTLSNTPVFTFELKNLYAFAASHQIDLPTKAKKKGKKEEAAIKFTTSAIAIHPLTKKLYLLSSTDPMIFVFDQEGKVEYMELLDAKIFNKAEGITFFENGDLLISNEGQKHKPTLLRFNFQH